jgi:hypothetical protein
MLDFQGYRRQGVYDEVEECAELSDLESMRDGLQDIQKSHRQVFKRVIKKIRVAIEERRKDISDDSDEDDDYQPISKGKTNEPENEDDVRRLFGSLVWSRRPSKVRSTHLPFCHRVTASGSVARLYPRPAPPN